MYVSILNCVEKSYQAELLVTFPNLYADLKNGKTSTLEEFVVEMICVSIKELNNELGRKLLELMCIDAADGIMLQCGRDKTIKSGN